MLAELHAAEEAAADGEQCLLRPVVVPVDGAAVDQAGELPRARAEALPHGGHSHHHVQVVAHAVDERLGASSWSPNNVHFVCFDSLNERNRLGLTSQCS